MDCVNLKREFGKRYRVRYEESYFAEYGENARVEDPWLMIIPCRNGHICPWGGEDLAAITGRSGSVANRLKALPFTTLVQEGSEGVVVLFHVKHVEEVAEIMKPRRRRRLSPEERARRVDRLRSYWADKRQVRALTVSTDAIEGRCATSESSGAVCGPN